MNKYKIALSLASKFHKGQKRKYNDEDYILHPIRVATILIPLYGIESIIVYAALLHDVIEDCNLSLEDIENIRTVFGEEVLVLIEEVTNISQTDEFLSKQNRKARKSADLDKIRGISRLGMNIKAADRIDNLLDMSNAPEGWMRKYLAESRELYNVISNNIHPMLRVKFISVIEKIDGELRGTNE